MATWWVFSKKYTQFLRFNWISQVLCQVFVEFLPIKNMLGLPLLHFTSFLKYVKDTQAASNKRPKDTIQSCCFTKMSFICSHNTHSSLDLGAFLMHDWFIGQVAWLTKKTLKVVMYKDIAQDHLKSIKKWVVVTVKKQDSFWCLFFNVTQCVFLL